MRKVKALSKNHALNQNAITTGLLPLALLAWSGPAFAEAWPLGPPPPLPPLTDPANRWSRLPAPNKPRWERVALQPRLRWERVPSHERILPDTLASADALAITDGPQTLELVLDTPAPRRWVPVNAPRRPVVGLVWFRF